MDISVVIPIFNELDNLGPLHEQLDQVLSKLGHDYEILFIDDGSTDGSVERLREIARRNARVKVVCFRRNFGQTAAMQAGLQMAAGDVIVTMDGDLQNDPNDIPVMLEKLDEGYDLPRRARCGLRPRCFAARRRLARGCSSRPAQRPRHSPGVRGFPPSLRSALAAPAEEPPTDRQGDWRAADRV